MGDAVLEAVRGLPDKQREATTLFYINGYSQSEIAGFLEVPVSRVKNRLAASLPGDTSNYCFACTTCTASCPVVRNFDNPLEALGMLPHQMIRAANLGIGDIIFDSNMLWSCLGCYACQDNCPQGVQITDVFYELKNLAMENAKERTLEA